MIDALSWAVAFLGAALFLSLVLNLWQWSGGRETARRAHESLLAWQMERGRLIGYLTGQALLKAGAIAAEPVPARAFGTDEDEWTVEQLRKQGERV